MDVEQKLVLMEERLSALERRQTRDSQDQWQYLADLRNQTIHPVTGSIKPKEAQDLLVMTLCNRDRS